jgi:hypothetical protein
MADNRAREEVSGEAKDFNSVVCDPVDILQFHPEIDLRKVMPPAQLHSTLSFNNFYGYLHRLCPYIARRYAKDCGVMPSPIHGDSDFPGNECRKLMKPESVDKLRKLIPTVTHSMISESKENVEDLAHFKSVFDTMRKVAVCLDGLNIIIGRVMTPLSIVIGEKDSHNSKIPSLAYLKTI